MAKTYRRDSYDRFERKKRVESRRTNKRDFYSPSHAQPTRERFAHSVDVRLEQDASVGV